MEMIMIIISGIFCLVIGTLFFVGFFVFAVNEIKSFRSGFGSCLKIFRSVSLSLAGVFVFVVGLLQFLTVVTGGL